MLIDLDPTAGPAWVVGAGSVGCRKVKTLLRHGFVVHWVTGPTSDPQYDELAQRVLLAHGQVLAQSYPHPTIDFTDAGMVVAATSNPTINASILKAANYAGVLAVAVDPHNVGTARFVAQRELAPQVWLGISTSGQDPKLAVQVVEHLSATLTEPWRSQLAALTPEALC